MVYKSPSNHITFILPTPHWVTKPLPMKNAITGIFFICLFSSCSTTRYYVIRHAEKTSNDCTAPLLQPQGFNRAQTLRDSLLSKHIDSIFVSTCLRTQQTAQPLATALNLTMIQFDPSAAQTQVLLSRLKKIRGKNMLVVGHTSTVPEIVLGLSGSSIAPIADTDFDNMFLVRIKRVLWSTNRRLIQSTYGVPTNWMKLDGWV